MKDKLIGIFVAFFLVIGGLGVQKAYDFRNDYLKIRAEHVELVKEHEALKTKLVDAEQHKAMWSFLAGVVAKDSKGNEIARAQVLDAMVQSAVAKK